ncbi:MAG: hypothetical protein KA436_10825, partial [Oligoflexales bacterium]|nr:hypothetical protein [Oligoflexales bacterium]
FNLLFSAVFFMIFDLVLRWPIDKGFELASSLWFKPVLTLDPPNGMYWLWHSVVIYSFLNFYKFLSGTTLTGVVHSP